MVTICAIQSTCIQSYCLHYNISKERVCEDSASFDLTSHDLAQCIGDVQHILDLKKKEQTYSEDGGSMSLYVS